MDEPTIANPQELYGERERCNYIFQKGINMNQQCPREIILGNCFCWTHAKTAYAKKLLSSNEVEVVEERKKTFDKLPSKKREDVDSDSKIIQLPQVEEEEGLEEILVNIPEEEPEEEEGGPDEALIIQQINLYYKNLPFLDEELPFDQQAELMPQEWLNQINLILNDRTSLKIVKLGFYTTASFVEHAGTHWFDLKLQGYEAMLRGNPEIKEILRILKIKHLSSLQEVTPEQKLLGIMLLSAVSIH